MRHWAHTLLCSSRTRRRTLTRDTDSLGLEHVGDRAYGREEQREKWSWRRIQNAKHVSRPLEWLEITMDWMELELTSPRCIGILRVRADVGLGLVSKSSMKPDIGHSCCTRSGIRNLSLLRERLRCPRHIITQLQRNPKTIHSVARLRLVRR